MKRRDFIAGLAGVASWPVAARAQQPERLRRIGVFSPVAADSPEGQSRLTSFLQRLQELGWTEGRNVRIDYRLAEGDAGRMRRHAADVIALGPDVCLGKWHDGLGPLLEATRTIPIVFGSCRPGRRRLRRKPGAAGRQRHRIHPSSSTA